MLESKILEAKTNPLVLEQVLTEFKPLVVSISRKYFLVGGEFEDLLQEGMIGLYKAAMTFEVSRNVKFITFATLCITRQIQTAIKKATRLKNVLYNEILDDDKVLDQILSSELNPEDKYIIKENSQKFQADINNALIDEDKQILKLYLANNSYEEIANKLNISKKSVDNKLCQIRRKLSQFIKIK